jgi:hypothetical protein
MEHQAPAARVRAGHISEDLQSSSHLGFETDVHAMQGRTSGTGGSEGAVCRTSERLRNLRLDFGESRGSPSVSQDFSSPAGEKKGGQIRSMDHSHSGPAIPTTALRKNITQRRSNGRARDSIGSSTSVPVPKVRLQDAAYVKETRSQKPSTPATSPSSGSPMLRTGAPASLPDFIRKQIPTELESPKLHKVLRAMWIGKKGIEEDIADAKQQGNDTQCQLLAEQHTAINQDMFAALHQAPTSGDDDEGSSTNKHDPPLASVITYYGIRRGHSIGVCDSWDELQSRIAGYPKPIFQSFPTWQDAKDYVIEGMWNDMPDSSRRFATPPPIRNRRLHNQGIGKVINMGSAATAEKGSLNLIHLGQAIDDGSNPNVPPLPPQLGSNDPKPWEDDSRSSFRIWLTYGDEEFPQVVWHGMPVALLVDAACRLLRQSGEDIRDDQIVLKHKNRVMDATFERLSDHNVEPEDQIEILVSISHPFSHSRRSDSNFQPTQSDSKSSYYAVREGRVPGIFRSWDECRLQVEGYPNCEFKSFKLDRDALNLLVCVGTRISLINKWRKQGMT